MKKIIVYGLGERYRIFEEWLWEEIKDECHIIAVSDKNKRPEKQYRRFIEIGEIAEQDFDILLITSDKYFSEIFYELHDSYGIAADKIISMENIIESIYRKKFLTELFSDKYGVEIGGPSAVFRNNIYQACSRCDGINYSVDTVWWKSKSNQYYYKNQMLGGVIISDAVNLSVIGDEKYDFCISSNNLEHIANPIKALEEQKRIVKKDGLILTIVPMKDKCFDHNRDFTDFGHLLDDYARGVSEDDLTHLDEIMDKHDFDMDSACGGKEKFAQRALRNYENRCLHQHVFHIDTLVSMYNYLGLSVLNCGKVSFNYYIIGKNH